MHRERTWKQMLILDFYHFKVKVLYMPYDQYDDEEPEGDSNEFRNLIAEYMQDADRWWEAAENPRTILLPNQLYKDVAAMTLPAPVHQRVIATCMIEGKEAILSLPFTIQNPTVKDLQVHSVEEIQAYIHQQRGVESMNTKIKRQADGIAQEISHLGLDLDAA